MARPVKVRITGQADAGTDAPTVDDLLSQIRDVLDLLRGVEKAVASNQSQELIWRVTGASMNSPVSVELTPFPKNPAIHIDERAEEVERAVAVGLRALRHGSPRPPFFTDEVLSKARKIHSRVLNGLSNTIIAFDPAIEAEQIVIDRSAAQEVQRTTEREIGEQAVPYTELGSVEGYVTKPELDGYGRAVLRFKARLGGAEIKAYASGSAFRQIEDLTLSDVWQGVRIRVYGTIHYKGLGQIESINATGIEVFENPNLPGYEDIVDDGFTHGLSTEEFLRELRGDD